MSITSADVIVGVNLLDKDIHEIVEIANKITPNIIDRADLHKRDYLERFIDVLMGEIAERVVIKWLNENGKYAVSAVDKNSEKPDAGHDILLKDQYGKSIKGSIKSSLSVFKEEINDILDFTIASKESEIRDVNIQVYFWLEIHAKKGYRVNVPSMCNFAIIGWVGKNDIKKFVSYKTENRKAPNKKLKEMRPMKILLEYIL